MQRCEQKNEKKNRITIEFSIFFSDLIVLINLLKSFYFTSYYFEKITIKFKGSIW